jgi:hypothetical protein
MSLRTKFAVVRLAEADCAVRRAAISASWRGFRQQSELAATPRRVVLVGLIAGFLSGLPRIGAKGSGSLLGGKLTGMLMDSAFASLSAAIAAGAAAATETASPAAAAATDRAER